MTIAEQIVRNPEGGTVDIEGDPLPDRGYFVGGAGTVLVFRTWHEIDEALIEQWFKDPATAYVGWWTDKETGKVYVDWSSWHDTFEQAKFWAERRGEIAFWNIGLGQSEPTKV